MIRNIALAFATTSLAVMPVAAAAETYGITLRGHVPVHCVVQHQLVGYGAQSGDDVALGQIREFCNAPQGYELVVSYTPGALRGATVTVGDDRIVLDGSGQAVLSRATGPRLRQRLISAAPGEKGFDTDVLHFQIQTI